MKNLNDDIEDTIREKIKTAKSVNNTYRWVAGRSLKLKRSGEKMAVYRKNKKEIELAEKQYLSEIEKKSVSN